MAARMLEQVTLNLAPCSYVLHISVSAEIIMAGLKSVDDEFMIAGRRQRQRIEDRRALRDASYGIALLNQLSASSISSWVSS